MYVHNKLEKLFNKTYMLEGKNLRPAMGEGKMNYYTLLGDLSKGYALITDKMCSTTPKSASKFLLL